MTIFFDIYSRGEIITPIFKFDVTKKPGHTLQPRAWVYKGKRLGNY